MTKKKRKKRIPKSKIEFAVILQARVCEPGPFSNIVLLDFYTSHVVIMNSELIGGVKDGGY
ncbi:hypothetical protein [Salinicoccus halitifaciens]|uniref:Uncharacterized protein n=1 Tax=Salinicoccus halitifaciens TaxID=1073415 RepID=A0ABV2E5E9_9STAP|nr:hypothetical protein [Salinicoccus halitifaciens]MCD2137273.1 hypothetical protein [Salinicoccus halitifaciens]